MATSLVNKSLTDKQKEFVKIYVESNGQLSKTECARLAGYDEKSAYQRAYEMTNPRICPHVVQEIGKYKQDYMEKYQVTPENHIQMLAKIRDMALKEKMYGVAGRMEELRGKATGLYVEKTMNLNRNENLSEEELDLRLKNIIKDWEHVLTSDEKKIETCEHGHVHYDSLERLCNLQTEYIKQCTKSIEMVDSHNVRLYQSNKILHERLIKMEEQMKVAEANMNLLVREVCTCYQHLTACKNPMHDRFLDEKVRLNVEQMKPKH